MDAATGAEARGDNATIGRGSRIQADVLSVQQGEGRAGIGGLPQTERRHPRSEGSHAAAERRADAAGTAGRADIKYGWIARISHDSRDRTAVEGRSGIGWRHQHSAAQTNRGAIDARALRDGRVRRQFRPRIAAVGGFIDAETCRRLGRLVRLARSRIEGAAGESEKSNRVGGEAPGDKCPAGRGVMHVVGAPDSAAGRRHEDTATSGIASWVHRDISHAARSNVRRATEGSDRRKIRSAGSEKSPIEKSRGGVGLHGAVGLDLERSPGLAGFLGYLERYVIGRIRPKSVFVFSQGGGPAFHRAGLGDAKEILFKKFMGVPAGASHHCFIIFVRSRPNDGDSTSGGQESGRSGDAQRRKTI
jgi:hypothetical protein